VNRGTLCAVIGFALAGFFQCRAEYPLPKNLSGNWLIESSDFSASENRTVWQRLLSSLAPWIETASDRASAKLTPDQAEISSSIYDNQNPSQINWIPNSYAVGISGGFKFHSFAEP
jgi:hypothetical protein